MKVSNRALAIVALLGAFATAALLLRSTKGGRVL